MPTGPGSNGQVPGGQALAGSSQVPGRRRRTEHVDQPHWQVLVVGAEDDGGDLADQPDQPAGGEQHHGHDQPEGVRDVVVLGIALAVTPHPSTSFRGSDGLGLPKARSAVPPAIGAVVGVGGVVGVAVLAVGLAGLGMTGRCLALVGAAGAVGRSQPADDPLRLTAPDAVLLAGPHREGQAVIAHQAGRADGDGLGLEFGAVGEERVVVGRHDVEAGGQVAPERAVMPPHPLAAALLVRPG